MVDDSTDVVIITDSGMVMRMPLAQISVLGRVTQGVRLINLKDGQKVSTISLIKAEPDDVLNESSITESENINQ